MIHFPNSDTRIMIHLPKGDTLTKGRYTYQREIHLPYTYRIHLPKGDTLSKMIHE